MTLGDLITTLEVLKVEFEIEDEFRLSLYGRTIFGEVDEDLYSVDEFIERLKSFNKDSGISLDTVFGDITYVTPLTRQTLELMMNQLEAREKYEIELQEL